MNTDEISPIRHLSKAPIAEAVIDIRVLPSESWNLESLKVGIENNMPYYVRKMEEENEFISALSPDGIELKREKIGCVGYKLTSNDDKSIIKFNKQGFIFSCVKDYPGWDEFLKQAKPCWETYCKLAGPEKVKAISVRFINKMIPKTSPFFLKEFFVNPPPEKQIDEWELGRFFYRDVSLVPQTKYRVNLIKTVTAQTSAEGMQAAVILDIGVFIEGEFETVWTGFVDHLSAMREIKNKAFFRNILKSKIEEYV